MAVPATATTQNMSGTYVLNKTLSDSSEALLKMQGIGFIVRQAVKYSTVNVTLKQYTDENGKVHLDQDQASTGGVKNSEERTCDGQWAEAENRIWGKVKGCTKYVRVEEVINAHHGRLADLFR